MIRLGLVGFGGVNRALAALLAQGAAGRPARFSVTAISDLEEGSVFVPEGVTGDRLLALAEGRGLLAQLPGRQAGPANERLVASPDVDIVVEASFTNPETGEPALSLCRQALANGKSVVTTNKGPVAFAGHELETLARRSGARFLYEGAVMSGTPVVRLARTGFPGAQIRGFRGILNGTTNFMLERMGDGLDFDAALRLAQEAGYAEANPTQDVGGHDVALKVTILANLLFGTQLRPAEIPIGGIGGSIPEGAPDNGVWKLIGEARRAADGSVEARVGLRWLSPEDTLAGIRGATNALELDVEYLGKLVCAGPGAGRVETAYALLSDLMTLDMGRGGADG